MSESHPPPEVKKDETVHETEGSHGVQRATLRSYLCSCLPGKGTRVSVTKKDKAAAKKEGSKADESTKGDAAKLAETQATAPETVPAASTGVEGS